MITLAAFSFRRFGRMGLAAALLVLSAVAGRADIIWSDLGATLAHETGPGADVLGGAVKRDDAAADTLYFKFHVNPISDAGTELYFAAFELYEGDKERLALGNSLNGFAYGAFNVFDARKTNFYIFETGNTNNQSTDYGIDLYSAKPTEKGRGGYFDYELPRKGIERTIVFKVKYIPGGKDAVTVWMDPDLGPGATEAGQLEALTTKFNANASFNQIRLRHGGGGDGWIFSEMAIATSFSDFVVDDSGIKSGNAGLTIGRGQLPFTFRVWQRDQGLPQNLVRALAQTRDGYLWIGSDAGVSRFDGVRFVPFGLPEGFQAGPVQTLLGDSKGALWIGTMGQGLGRSQNGHSTAFTTRDGLPSDSINALAEDTAGKIWVGTESGLAVWANGHFASLDTLTGLAGKAITALYCDRDGTTWIGVRGAGVFSLQSNGKLTQVHDPIFDNLLADPHCLLVDHEGRIWVGAGDDSVLYREGTQWRSYRFPRHLARHYISSLAEDSDGTVWAGSVSDGLFQFKHGKLVAVNVSSGLSDNLVEALLVDREGKLWVGTHGGLDRLRPKNLSVIGYNEGLGEGSVQGLAEVIPGVIWASKAAEGLYLWDSRAYFRPLQAAGLSPGDGWAGALMMAKDGSCWMGGARGLLHFKDVRNVETVPGEPALTNLEISAMGQDGQGRLWVGTRQGGIWRQSRGKWVMAKGGPRVHAITAIVPQRDGSAWVGTAGDGLFNVDGNGPWKKVNGLLSEWVRTLYQDADGALWIGTGGGGLGRLKDSQPAFFTTREGLPDNTISQILEDDAGNLWLGGDLGIVCVSKRDLDGLAAHKKPAAYPRVYGRTEGMLSEECVSGFFPVGLRTKSGLLWFPTQEGIVVADPHRQTLGPPVPSVVLEETMVDGVRVPDASEPLHLSPGKHRLEFHYTGLDFDSPERVRFRYRLEGLDSDWVEDSSRSASFPFVPYGKYKFEVVAGNGEDGWEKTGASLPVVVEPYLWQSWWFRVPATLGLLAVIAVTARVVEKRKLQRRLEQLEQERALAHERERIARDLHDDLGSSLARISLLSGLLRADRGNPNQVESHAVKISQSADQTVRALEEIVWAVRPGSDSLQSLIEYIAHFANELFEGGAIHCRLDLPHDLPAHPLPPEVRHNIFLVVKEALTNTLKHAGAHEVHVRAEATAEALEIMVQDDGKGFDLHGKNRGNGLGNMRRRAQAIGETVTVESRPGQGTIVRLTLHFAPAHNNGKAVA